MYSFFYIYKKKEQKEGLSAFKLVIFKLDSSKFNSQDALILEQYFLLDKNYNLNTLKVVNFGPQLGKSIFIYDLSCRVLYYCSHSLISLKRKLKIKIKLKQILLLLTLHGFTKFRWKF